MRISGDNQRLRSIIGKLRRPLIRIIIPRDKAGSVCGNSMLESNPLRHLHTAFIERKFPFRRMIRQKPDVRIVCGDSVHQLIVVCEGVDGIARKVKRHTICLENVTEMGNIGRGNIRSRMPVWRLCIDGINRERSE